MEAPKRETWIDSGAVMHCIKDLIDKTGSSRAGMVFHN